VIAACESAFPGQGSNLNKEWRARQFEYQWLTVLAGKYQDFWETTRNALEFAARSINVDAAGARWFGYPTFWNNRLSAVSEELGVMPDFAGASLDALTTLLDFGR
jgi:hypothetical protein